MTAVAPVPGGVTIRVRVVTRASRTELAGAQGDAVRIRVAAPPVDGAANDEVVRFLARLLEVPRGQIRIVRGGASRTKLVAVRGADAEAARARLGLYAEGDAR